MAPHRKSLPTRDPAPSRRKPTRPARRGGALPIPGSRPPADALPSLHSLAQDSIPPNWQDEDERYRPSAAHMLLGNVPFYDEILPTAPVSTPPPGDVSVNPANGMDSVAPVAFAVRPPAAPPMAFPRQPDDAGLRQVLMAFTIAVGVSLGALAADLTVPAVNSTALRASSAQLSVLEIELAAPEIDLAAAALEPAAPQAIALPTLTIVIGDSHKAPQAAAPMIQKSQPAATAAEPNGDLAEWVPDDV